MSTNEHDTPLGFPRVEAPAVEGTGTVSSVNTFYTPGGVEPQKWASAAPIEAREAPAVDPVEQARAAYEAAHRVECAAWSAYTDARRAVQKAKRALEEAEKAAGDKR
jgi:hypothetical protein